MPKKGPKPRPSQPPIEPPTTEEPPPAPTPPPPTSGVLPIIALRADLTGLISTQMLYDKALNDFKRGAEWWKSVTGKTFQVMNPRIVVWTPEEFPDTDFGLWHHLIDVQADKCDAGIMQYLHVLGANASGGMVGSENWGCNFILPGKACIADGFAFVAFGLDQTQFGFPPQDWWANTVDQSIGARMHELGHAFGNGVDQPLAHSEAPSVMFAWWDWPNCTFFDYEIEILNNGCPLLA